MTSGTFDTARISQIISKTFHALCNLTIHFTDKSSCTVEIYKAVNATTLALVPDSGSCNYTWGIRTSKHAAYC